MSDQSPFAAALAAIGPDERLVAYWTDGERFAFEVAPFRVDDTMLVYADGRARWEHVGPLAPDGDRYAELLSGEPTPYASTIGRDDTDTE